MKDITLHLKIYCFVQCELCTTLYAETPSRMLKFTEINFYLCVSSGDCVGGEILEASHGISDGGIQEMAAVFQEEVCSRPQRHAGSHRCKKP